jgi:CheY-like chemotaxis protein
MDFGLDGLSITLIVLGVLAILVVFAGVKTVPQGYNYTVERFGRYTRTLSPGLNLIVPFVDGIGKRINMMEQVLDVPHQEVITRDNATVTANGVTFFQILDAAAAAYEVAQLEVAVLNLIFNARDAVGKEGTIQIRARNEQASIAPSSHGDQVVIEVADNGSGIPAEIREKVFEPFFTTKPVGQGTGLGLSQVYGFAAESGGSVSLQSEGGQGTTVSIRLPRATRPPAGEEPAGSVVRLHRTCRLLFVEDDALVAEVVSSALKGAGFDTLRCRTADEALALLRNGECFDAVFSDIVMPGSLSGIDLAEILGKEHPELPVVLASGYSERAPLHHTVTVLSKPDSIEALVRTLVEALRDGRSQE